MLTMQYMDVADSFAKNSVSSLVIPSAGGKQAIKNSTEMRLRGCGGPEKRGVRNGAFQPGGMAKTSPPPPARTTPVAAKTIPLVPNFSTTFDSSKSTGRETPGVAARYVMHARMSAFAWVPFRLADESRVRIVVLRKSDRENNIIQYHSDIRSDKIAKLKANKNAAMLFYDKDSTK